MELNELLKIYLMKGNKGKNNESDSDKMRKKKKKVFQKLGNLKKKYILGKC
jgi:hypothetical protein